ncbi:MAG: DNA recombination protein RmuC [Rudaea sp.]|uniref:DNA recombination protein RmuC n=1 Tax=Rudaea sp. TaxID=2136325 RepID=UPI0039E2B42F
MSTISNEYALWGLIAFAAFVLGAVLAWAFVRTRAFASGRTSRDAEITQLASERDAASDDVRRLQGEYDAIARELAEQRKTVFALGNERANLAGRLERLGPLEAELAAARAEAQKWREATQRAEQRVTETATRMQEHQQAAAEKITLLERVRENLSDQFKALAGDLLEEKSRKFTEQNQTQLGSLLGPLREQLDGFRKQVGEVYDKESRERQLLKAEIDALRNLNQRIDEDARNLTRALTRESKAQGAWGELVLERLLEASGLQKGRQYETQATFENEAGGRARPDVIVRLPEGRDIVVDAKVSLTAYERYCAATDDAERGTQLAAHLASLRGHVKELADKRYSDLPGVNSLEFVLMFVPVEAAYIEAVHCDDALHAFALEKQVVIVTTSTLLATLQTVASLWRNDDRNRNVAEIADRAGRLYDKFVGFIDDLNDAKAKLDAARNALASASGKLETGRGNLIGQVEKLRELGARTSKTLPEAQVERAQLDEVQGRLG